MKKKLICLFLILFFAGLFHVSFLKNKNENIAKQENKDYVEAELIKVIDENITIDLYKGYDVKEFILSDVDTIIVDELDKENNVIHVTAMRENQKQQIDLPVKIVDTNPYPLVCKGQYDNYGEKIPFDWIFLSENRVKQVSSISEITCNFDKEKLAISCPEVSSIDKRITKIDDYTFEYSYAFLPGGIELFYRFKSETKLPF